MFGSDKPKPAKADEGLIMAFVNEYEMVETEELADDVFDFARLREYFGAFQIPKMPDPLPPYTQRLTEEEGFVFRMSYSGDPALFVRRKHKPKTYGFTPSLEWDDEEQPLSPALPQMGGSSYGQSNALPLKENEDDDIFRMAGYEEDEDEEEDDEDE